MMKYLILMTALVICSSSTFAQTNSLSPMSPGQTWKCNWTSPGDNSGTLTIFRQTDGQYLIASTVEATDSPTKDDNSVVDITILKSIQGGHISGRLLIDKDGSGSYTYSNPSLDGGDRVENETLSSCAPTPAVQ